MIEILSRAALASVQDLGRFDAFRWGVGLSGAMDPLALTCGNILLGNEDGAAAVEMQVFPFSVRFEADTLFALTGADCAAMLDGVPLLPWSRAQAKAGAVLRLDHARDGRWRGARAYLCVAGGIDVPEVLGSRSTQLRGAIGGFDGRMLREGDRLPLGRAAGESRGTEIALVPPGLALPLEADGLPAVRVLPAAEYGRFTPASLDAFWREPFRITPQSDRYGFRLAGPGLEPVAPMELRSHGIVPGVIQVPHNGQPIVQMCEGQPSGGYPKVGTVIEADLWRLGQMPIGTRFRFLATDWDGALAALDERQAWLAEVRRLADLLSARSAAR
ncbi:biotin-dependent carboxyltransferase family protein [Antarcticirhabdus aurantiaca]|uniref:Biotin-dependent carboxyltransferase family protein n=1 Tax=Antarcticirhabdus aurantiaca TaxID=2606717 RepID=A0ACD4NSV3_9HYPH|nr:biotin-dependent carboxyltransferase family protein [Antarcticirhabdus aurantiaca]WAJ29940.1 biotin-dependent carboxyltransferase family protein [Jeongeuplla avenae]